MPQVRGSSSSWIWLCGHWDKSWNFWGWKGFESPSLSTGDAFHGPHVDKSHMDESRGARSSWFCWEWLRSQGMGCSRSGAGEWFWLTQGWSPRWAAAAGSGPAEPLGSAIPGCHTRPGDVTPSVTHREGGGRNSELSNPSWFLLGRVSAFGNF